MHKTGTIYGINGPVIYLKGNTGFQMAEMVYVGKERLVGEVIRLTNDITTIQVFEETTGLRPGDPVEATGDAISVTLGPGILNNIFDGIERPLSEIAKSSGKYISRGVSVDSLDTEKKWQTHITVKPGEFVSGGTIIAEVQETQAIVHKSMVPPNISGTVLEVAMDGEYTINEPIVTVQLANGKEEKLTLAQKWPIRVPRPTAARFAASKPLITGQRILDTLFPIAKGGVAAVPGPFGSGKTVIQHQLAKWAEADIVVYIGCGERGNEMTDVLNEFPELKDPKTGQSLMERTVLIANTSDMPVAAREASIYTGITIAEYFRDMGYSVALMADSTSRWAEALREMSGRLEEMPGEEGYPAYLGSRLAQFYERAGHVVSLGKEGREGALSVIGAVSPPGGDISEPVSQATLRIVKVFWGLDSALAYKRHFPAINWLTSYSLYVDNMANWFNEEVAADWMEDRQKMMTILQEEAELNEIVQMVGMDALSPTDRLKMEAARSIREDFLHQNSFHEIDTYTPLRKQYLMMKLVLAFYEKSVDALNKGADMNALIAMPVREKIGRYKYTTDADIESEYKNVEEELDKEVAAAFGKEDF